MERAREISLLTPALGTRNVGDHFIELAIRRLLRPEVVYHRFSIRRALRSDEIDRINRTSCAIICGTNLYQHEWESDLTPEVLRKISVPIIPFGVGSSARSLNDTEVSEQTRDMIRAIHQRCVAGSVRDPHSLRVVQRAGVKNVILTGCPVMFWAGRQTLPQINPGRRIRELIITSRNYLMHRWPENVDHPVQIELLRRIVAHFGRQSIVYAVHEDFDRSLIQMLGLQDSKVLDSSQADDYIRLYSEPENVVLALRLHAGMLARANGLATVFVGHDTRTYAFCEMMGIQCIDLFAQDAATRCIERLEQALAGKPAVDGAGQEFPRLACEMSRFIESNNLPARSSSATGSVVFSGGVC